MYPRARFDAVTDGIFSVAMTLLVLDLRLPEDFHPHDAEELLQGLFGLVPKFIPYLLSFLVLGLRWLSNVQVHSKAEHVGRRYFRWWLIYLLLITCVPFSTLVVGRFASLAPAIWLYAGNTALLALASMGLLVQRRRSSATNICATARCPLPSFSRVRSLRSLGASTIRVRPC